MPLRFQGIPEDILFKIISFVLPLDIIHLRQTSRWAYNFTMERTLWTSFYRNSSLFIPSIELVSQPLSELERILVHAQRFHANRKGPEKHRRLLKAPIFQEGVRGIELYLGRYLLLGTFTRFALFDLDRVDWDAPIYAIPAGGDRYSYPTWYRKNPTRIGEIYIPMFRMRGKSISIILWHLRPAANPPLVEIDELLVSPNNTLHSAWASQTLLIYHSENLKTPTVYQIATKRVYRFLEGPVSLDSPNTQPPITGGAHHYHHEYIPASNFILAIHVGLNETMFEVFLIPDSDSDILTRTHVGTYTQGLTEPALLSPFRSSIDLKSIDTSITLSMSAIFHDDDLRIFKAILQPDGQIRFVFDLPSSDISPRSYNLAIAADQTGSVRAASLSAKFSNLLFLHEVDGSGNSLMSSVPLTVPELSHGHDYAWDAFRGRLCVQPGDEFHILDYA